ncbi:MAG: HAD family phosphatase [Symploca sp. SIO3E6]|nr:HAD family phosphatase [Caldora sp. SIO3E6]
MSPYTNSLSPPDIRLLILDIDGTITGEFNGIRQTVIEAVQAAQTQGVQVALATGRSYQSALPFYKDIGSTLPLIAYDGALIREPQTGTVLRHLSIEPQVAAQLLDYLEHHEREERLSIHIHIEDKIFIQNFDATTLAYLEQFQLQAIPVSDLRQVLDQGLTKVKALSQDSHMLSQLLHSLQQHYNHNPTQLCLTQFEEISLEAVHPNANKGTAVNYLAETLLVLQREQVMAIGNEFNDVEMLKYAGIGVAMGNAPEAVQAIADWVAPSVEADGVAAAIQTWILQTNPFVFLNKQPTANNQ